jgi:hypothetical protein
VEKAYADALSKGVQENSFQYLDDTIRVFTKADGTFDTTYGTYKLDPSYFGSR